jgi:hypothetical protein
LVRFGTNTCHARSKSARASSKVAALAVSVGTGAREAGYT